MKNLIRIENLLNEVSIQLVELKKSENIKTKVVKKIIKVEKPLTARQLNFKKDDTKTLISKMKDKRFSTYRTEILDILKKRYTTAKQKPTDRNKKNIELIRDYFVEIFDELMKSTEIKKVA